jgi:nicotinamide phosphoribosyltransferase
MKATYVEIDGIGREIFKDPITDDGTKKSAKGLLAVYQNEYDGEYELHDQVTWEQEKTGELKTIFKDGEYSDPVTLTEVRARVTNNLVKMVPNLNK